MGRANIAAVARAEGLQLAGALDRSGADSIGMDTGHLAGPEAAGITVSDDIGATLDGADALIDFTTPQATLELAKHAAERGLVHVIGTTGCTDADEKALHAAAEAGARIVKSGNMSLGVNLLAVLVRQAAAALGEDFDIEVLEMHHRNKVDAPSGTALLLGEAAAEGREIDLSQKSVRVRDGHTGARETGTIGFATLRGGSVIGEHSVILAGGSERIELTHKAEDRSLFANGAIKAARWAADKPAGYYTMTDVLGLNQ